MKTVYEYILDDSVIGNQTIYMPKDAEILHAIKFTCD